MKLLSRPRFWIALTVAAAAALLAWQLPPLHHCTARLPNQGSPGYGQPPFMLLAISSNARYFITQGTHDDAEVTYKKIHIWDRTIGFDRPTISVEGADSGLSILLSPDETQLAIAGVLPADSNVPAPGVLIYDLASARRLRKWEVKCDHMLFSPEGRLLVVRDGVLRDLDTNQEIRRLPNTIDGFTFVYCIGEFGVYQNDQLVRLYFLHSGELHVTHDLIGNKMGIRSLSGDGQTLIASGWPPGVSPWTAARLDVLLDGSTGTTQRSQTRALANCVMSPDGRHVAQFGEVTRSGWLTKWWRGEETIRSVRLTHWTTETDVAQFTNVAHVYFSPAGNQVALMREDYTIDVYDFPIRKPFVLILSVAVIAGAASWGLGYLWMRWRIRTGKSSK